MDPDALVPRLFRWLFGTSARRRNIDAFTDSNGVIHPIRGTQGYNEAEGTAGIHPYYIKQAELIHKQYSRPLTPEMTKMYGEWAKPQAGSLQAATVGEIARHIVLVNDVKKEHPNIGHNLDPVKLWGQTKAQIEELAVSKEKKHKGRAGVRALVRKYGADSAARIVKDYSGKTIHEARPEAFDQRLQTPAMRAAHERRIAIRHV